MTEIKLRCRYTPTNHCVPNMTRSRGRTRGRPWHLWTSLDNEFQLGWNPGMVELTKGLQSEVGAMDGLILALFQTSQIIESNLSQF